MASRSRGIAALRVLAAWVAFAAGREIDMAITRGGLRRRQAVRSTMIFHSY